jgi:hypothetical protein
MAGPTSQTRLEAEAPELAGVLRSFEGTVLDALGAGFSISELRVLLEGLQGQVSQAVKERSGKGVSQGPPTSQVFSDTDAGGGQSAPPIGRDVPPPTPTIPGVG